MGRSGRITEQGTGQASGDWMIAAWLPYAPAVLAASLGLDHSLAVRPAASPVESRGRKKGPHPPAPTTAS